MKNSSCDIIHQITVSGTMFYIPHGKILIISNYILKSQGKDLNNRTELSFSNYGGDILMQWSFLKSSKWYNFAFLCNPCLLK